MPSILWWRDCIKAKLWRVPQHLSQVLVKFCQAGLKLKPSKSQLFHWGEYHFLVTSFLRQAYHVIWVRLLSFKFGQCLAISLSFEVFFDFLQTTPFKWSEAYKQAFTTLKTQLTQYPVLAYLSPDPNHVFVLDTDNCKFSKGSQWGQMCDTTIFRDNFLCVISLLFKFVFDIWVHKSFTLHPRYCCFSVATYGKYVQWGKAIAVLYIFIGDFCCY